MSQNNLRVDIPVATPLELAKQLYKGDTGADGANAYAVAVENGFEGSIEEWLLSLKGEKGDKGDAGSSANIPTEIYYYLNSTGLHSVITEETYLGEPKIKVQISTFEGGLSWVFAGFQISISSIPAIYLDARPTTGKRIDCIYLSDNLFFVTGIVGDPAPQPITEKYWLKLIEISIDSLQTVDINGLAWNIQCSDGAGGFVSDDNFNFKDGTLTVGFTDGDSTRIATFSGINGTNGIVINNGNGFGSNALIVGSNEGIYTENEIGIYENANGNPLVVFDTNNSIIHFGNVISEYNERMGINNTAPNSSIEINGSEGKNIAVVSANTTLTISHNVVFVDTTFSDITITLPQVNTCWNRIYSIKNIGINKVIIDADSSETIEGNTTYTLNNINESIEIISDSPEWKILNLKIDVWNGSIIPLTYADLKALKDAESLVQGQQYLITDYYTKHLIPNTTTINTGILDPLIVTALTNADLSKTAISYQYAQDIIYYNFDDSSCEDGTWDTPSQRYIGGTPRTGKISYRKDTVTGNETHYDFRNVKFRRWGIDADFYVSYTQYNIRSIYKSNDNSNIYIVKELISDNENIIDSTDPRVQLLYNIQTTPTGKYISYSPDNSEFAQTGNLNYSQLIIDSEDYVDYYTFNIYDEPANSSGILQSNITGSQKSGFHNMKIGALLDLNALSFSDLPLTYNNNIFIFQSDGSLEYQIYSNEFGYNCYQNTFNIIGTFIENKIGDSFNNNVFSSIFTYNTIANLFQYNSINDNFCYNIISNLFQSNSINDNFCYNIISNLFQYNITAAFTFNNIGTSFFSNILIDSFSFNDIIGNFNNNNISNSFAYNKIGQSFSRNTIAANFNANTIASNFISNTIGNYFSNNIIGNTFTENLIGSAFQYNNIGNGFLENIIVDGFQFNTTCYATQSIDFTPATHVYGNYECTILRRQDRTLRLTFWNNNNQLSITNITN